jgi:hypothetical protein
LILAMGLGLCRAGFEWAALGVLASGGVVLYEAARGWCVLRACGIKTRV